MSSSPLSRHTALITQSWAVSWPMTLIMFLVFIIGLCDVYAAGRFGKEIQAAYGLAFQLYFIFGIVAAALTVGAVSVISRLFTSPENGDLSAAVDSSLALAAAAGVILSVISFIAGPLIVGLYQVPQTVKNASAALIRLYSAGMLFNFLLYTTNGVLRACALIRQSLVTMSVVCALNTALVFMLSFKTPLGYRGIALATVAATIIGASLNLFKVRMFLALSTHAPVPPGGFHARFRILVPIMRSIVRVSWPAGLLQALWQLGAMALYFIVSRLPFNNVETMAAFTNGLRIESAIFLPAFAFNMSNAVVVGNLLGGKKRGDAFPAGIVTALIGVGIVTALTVIILFNARGIAGALSRNPIVVMESVRYIYISLILEPAMAWGVILGGGLNGAGDTKSVMISVVFSVWAVRIPLAYCLAIGAGWGAPAIWWAMNASLLVQTFLITRRYFGRNWLGVV